MSGCFGTHAEDRYMERGLNRYLDKQDTEEQKAARVEQRANNLMQKGQECYPWTLENMLEAIANAPAAQQRMMFACVASAVDLSLNNDHCTHMAMVSMRQLVERYWVEVAAHMADAREE